MVTLAKPFYFNLSIPFVLKFFLLIQGTSEHTQIQLDSIHSGMEVNKELYVSFP
jgi:hypothetical protein